jgi:hypothetical protein
MMPRMSVAPPLEAAPASAPAPARDPAAHYRARLVSCAEARRRAQRVHDLVAWGRVAALLAVVVVGYQRCGGRGGSTAAVLAALAALVGLWVGVSAAARVLGRLAEAERYYELGLQRLAGEAAAAVSEGEQHQPPDHLYAADLDLFGPGSLFARLCVARTSTGQGTLAGWLLAPAGADEVRARQAAVAELRDRPELREELWRAAGPVSRDVRAERLGGWLGARVQPPPAWARVAALALALVAVPAVYLLIEGQIVPALVLFAVELLFSRGQRALVEDAARQGQHRADELGAVAVLAAVVERERWHSPLLVDVQRALASQGVPASRRIAQLVRRVEWFESRRNPFYALMSAPFLVTTQLAFAIQAWRARHGEPAARWLARLGELEALVSLATYAFEHPEQPFPEVVPDAEGPLYQAVAVAHPLLPPATRVANDVTLDRDMRLLLVTGSNMSGKSTLLRTVGTSAVLALAGAPVPAVSLRLSRLEIGATLRTSDSLQAGVSRFFAEIQRLRAIAALTEKTPLVLFLLDEILHGTNSQDRFAGAAALVRVLVRRGAVGLVTTHDLTLARIVDELAAAARNVHFEDVINEDGMQFDYRLRPGVVSRGNALALMKLVGLPVD